jgi:hypothetical protein
MKSDPSPGARLRVQIAQRVADAHRGIDDASLLSFVSGSTVDNLVDDLSDVDMSVVFDTLPSEATLRAASRRVGSDWTWSIGDWAQASVVVAFVVDGIEVQIGYATHAALATDIDDLLLAHNPDTPNHKLAEGIGKALPLAGAERLAALQARLKDFPDGLRRAMVMHGLLATPTPWRAARQLLQRDAALWCRDIQVDACYRLLLVLCGLNRRYFTRFQVKRMHRLADKLSVAPPRLAERIETLLAAPANHAFTELHALEGEVFVLVAQQLPELDISTALKRHGAVAWP